MCTLANEAKKIDEKTCAARFQRFKCASYKLTDLLQRIEAMYRNEIVNIKSRFETLHGTNVADKAFQGAELKTLEDITMNIKHRQHNLFIAIEQSAGK